MSIDVSKVTFCTNYDGSRQLLGDGELGEVRGVGMFVCVCVYG